MSSDGDRDEALSICNKGLLASQEVSREAFAATGRRFIQQVVEPLEIQQPVGSQTLPKGGNARC
jgi:hypothetical protein